MVTHTIGIHEIRFAFGQCRLTVADMEDAVVALPQIRRVLFASNESRPHASDLLLSCPRRPK
jgi:hypothetical protein